MTFTELTKKIGNQIESNWHQHKNGGGWVENKSDVADSVYVGPDAFVSGDARVSGNAQVYGDARVYGDAWV
jgi:hypothetical protein